MAARRWALEKNFHSNLRTRPIAVSTRPGSPVLQHHNNRTVVIGERRCDGWACRWSRAWAVRTSRRRAKYSIGLLDSQEPGRMTFPCDPKRGLLPMLKLPKASLSGPR